MIRLHIFCEGKSELRFVEEILVNHLGNHGISTSASAISTSMERKKGLQHKGGLNSYHQAKHEIEKKLKDDKNSDFRVSTMIDLYGLPSSFPKHAEAKNKQNPADRTALLERAF